MNEPEQLENGKPLFVAQSMTVASLPDENLATLSRVEFRVLLDGDTNAEKSARDLCIGVLASAIVGLVGLIATIDWSAAAAQRKSGPLVWVLVMSVILAGSLAGTLVFQYTMWRRGNGSAYSSLMDRLKKHFGGG